jgi:uncharacterized protein (TIGR03437 family)
MKSHAMFLAPMAALLSCLSLFAADPVSLLPSDSLGSLIASGFEATAIQTFNQPQTGKTLRIQTASLARNPWDARLIGIGGASIAKTDSVLATFRMRTVGMGDSPGYVRFVMEANNDSNTKLVEWSERIGPEWAEYQVPVTVTENYPALLYTIQFWFPLGPQVVELTKLEVKNLGAVPVSSLNLTGYPYAGSDPGAAWRRAAEDRIEQIRKGDLTVVVRTPDGRPVPNAPVHLVMKKHAFGFGSAVAAEWLFNATSDGDTYRKTFLQMFNKAVLENDLKWTEWEINRSRALAGLAWLRNAGVRQVRGHNLVWPSWRYVPSDVPGQGRPEGLRQRINSHIADVVGSVRGLVTAWDVVNEPVSNRDIQSVLGDSEMAEWFRQARRADAAPKLFVNEDGIVVDGGNNILQQDAYFRIAKTLIESGAPLERIGIEAHFNDHLTPPEDVLKILDRFASLGKEMEITEFDLNIRDEALQARYTRDFLTAVFSHPSINGLLVWGFWEGRHWVPQAAMYRKDWTAKPAADVWRDLVFRQWWSDVSGVTDEHGVFTARVFYGDYDAQTTIDGKAVTVSLSHEAGPATSVSIGPVEVGPLSPSAVVNSASLARGAVAPGELVTIYTRDFGPEPPLSANFDSAGQLPRSLAGRRVLVNEQVAPILEVTRDSIRSGLPFNLGGMVTLQLDLFGVQTNPVWLPVADAALGVFTSGSNGQGQAVTLDDSGVANSSAHPATAGSALTVRVTGLGRVTGIEQGQDVISPVPLNVPISVTVAAAPARIELAQWVSPGIAEIRFYLPENLAAKGDVPLIVRAAGQESQFGVTVYVQ